MPVKPYRVGRAFTGLGLFATQPFAKNDFIVEYSGKRVLSSVAFAEEKNDQNKYMFELNSRWTIDGSTRRNLARYINHACKPNAEADIKKGKILISARKRIAPGEEITIDYGSDYIELFFDPAGGCRCAHCKPHRHRRPAKKSRRK